MAAYGTDPFVLIEYLGRGIQLSLQPPRPVEGAWPEEPVCLHNFVRYVDVPFLADLLLDDLHWKEWGEVGRPDRLPCARVEDGGRGRVQVGLDVVPGPRYILLVEQILCALARQIGLPLQLIAINVRIHGCSPFMLSIVRSILT